MIPSAASAARTDFWDRMLGRASNRAAKLGPATLDALQDLALSPPPPSAIAERDFWKILTLYMSRGFTPSGPPIQSAALTSILATSQSLGIPTASFDSFWTRKNLPGAPQPQRLGLACSSMSI